MNRRSALTGNRQIAPHDPTRATPPGHPESFETIRFSPLTDHNHAADYRALLSKASVIYVHSPIEQQQH
jgi:hypothetical protein